MNARTIVAWAMIGIFGMALPAQAQNISAGEQIAKTWCSGCHRIDDKSLTRGNDAVPSFPAIAQMVSTTDISLAAFLTTPHGRMPDYALSRTEIQNVSAYIVSLRKPSGQGAVRAP